MGSPHLKRHSKCEQNVMWVKDLGGERICCGLKLLIAGLVFLSSTNLFLLVHSLLKNDSGLLSERA